MLTEVDCFVSIDAKAATFQFNCWTLSGPPFSVNNDIVATVVSRPTTWLASSSKNSVAELNVGDTILVGEDPTVGSSVAMRVLEKVKCNKIANGIDLAAGNDLPDPDYLRFPALAFDDRILIADSSGINPGATGYQETYSSDLLPKLATTSVAAPEVAGTTVFETSDLTSVDHTVYAYRVSAAYNFTIPFIPNTKFYHSTTPSVTSVAPWSKYCACVQRSLQKGYTMYRVYKLDTQKSVTLDLDRQFKSIGGIKLTAYEVIRHQAGAEFASLVPTDDYAILRLNGQHGHVVSNVPAADKTFCVLHTNGYQNDPAGLATHKFDDWKHLTSLTFDVVRSDDTPAAFSKIHLWLKLTCKC